VITLEQSIEIYARAMRAWFMHNAAVRAAMRAEQCRSFGDHEGVDVWLRVKEEVERLNVANELVKRIY
jgi:hypothetical protein